MNEHPDYGINWTALQGDRACLRWNRKNMATLAMWCDKYVTSHGTVIQAGGNLGAFPKWLSRRFQRVVTFEPDAGHFRTMCTNVPEPNVILIQAALGFERRSVGMGHVNAWGRTHAGVTHIAGEGLIPTLRIDDLGLKDVGFIVLDTEGHELDALRGAQQTLKDCHPVIMSEINKNAKLNGWGYADVECFLGAFDYTLAEAAGADKIFIPRN